MSSRNRNRGRGKRSRRMREITREEIKEACKVEKNRSNKRKKWEY